MKLTVMEQDSAAAIAADPNYALAYTGLAKSYSLMAANGSSLQIASRQARTAANKALRIDPTLSEPHAILAVIAQNHDLDWVGSEREFKLAKALDRPRIRGLDCSPATPLQSLTPPCYPWGIGHV